MHKAVGEPPEAAGDTNADGDRRARRAAEVGRLPHLSGRAMGHLCPDGGRRLARGWCVLCPESVRPCGNAGSQAPEQVEEPVRLTLMRMR